MSLRVFGAFGKHWAGPWTHNCQCHEAKNTTKETSTHDKFCFNNIIERTTDVNWQWNRKPAQIELVMNTMLYRNLRDIKPIQWCKVHNTIVRTGANPRNGVTHWWSKQILKVKTKKRTLFKAHSTEPSPLDPPLTCPNISFLLFCFSRSSFKKGTR